MGDAEFIQYCRIHSTTERALFNAPQVARLCRLAGEDALAARWAELPDNHWRSLDLTDLCDQARKDRP